MQRRAARVFVMSSCLVSRIALLAALLLAREAVADEPKPAVAHLPQDEVRAWRISTGLGFGATIGGLGAGGTPMLVGAPGGYVGFERRLVGPLWALARFGGEYARYTQSPGEFTTSLAGVGGSVGLRVAFTSPKILEVSAFGLFGGSYDTSSSAAPGGQRRQSMRSQSRSVGGQLGLALDREIVPGFGLRVSSVLARATYARATSSADDGAGHTSAGSESTSAIQIEVAPALELVWSF